MGRLSQADESAGDVEAAQAYLARYELDFPGQTGHCELDLGPLMREGLDGLARMNSWTAQCVPWGRKQYRSGCL